MIPRLLQLPHDESFFLFGARGTGKTTLIEASFDQETALYINLLKTEEEARFARNPDQLIDLVAGMPATQTHVIIDEIQKLPKLLDVVHYLIEKTNKYFILTGSSARKLKRGGANLLAGRAFEYHLFPLNYLEIKQQFNLIDALQWGMLPKQQEHLTEDKKSKYLQAYANTYLKEEVWEEQVIQELDPFRRFLEVAAQSNGEIINLSNIANDVGVDDKTVRNYFSILEDTLIGFVLEPFQHSFRKRLSKKPKFFFFDTGVARALSYRLTIPLQPKTRPYGDAFEHFIITQCKQLASYARKDYRFSYLRTKDDAEVDLIVERPGLPLLFIEIKSSEEVDARAIVTLRQLARDYGDCEAVCFCNEKHPKLIDGVFVFPWQQGMQKYFWD